MEKIPMTQPGYTRLEQELKILKSVERPAVIGAIAEARAHGDLSENAEYSAARERQSFIEGRILELEDKLSRADVIDTSKIVSAHIQFGAHVHLVDEDTEIEVKYQIVSDYEANIDHGRISTSAPIARALIGKTIGESVEVHTPRGLKAYEVLMIVYE